MVSIAIIVQRWLCSLTIVCDVTQKEGVIRFNAVIGTTEEHGQNDE